MRETLRCLRGLQELDKDLYRARDEVARLPKERDKRSTQLDNERTRAKEYEARSLELRMKIKEIEDLTTAQRQRIRKLEGEIANSRDTATVVAFQHEIRSLKRSISEAEEEGLGLVEKADALDAEHQQFTENLTQAEKEFEEYSQNVDSELSQAETRLAELDKERQGRLAGNVSAAVLDQYERLLDAREGQAMALLVGRVCQGCYVGVPSNIYVKLARAAELVLCPSCGRILYLPDSE